ncbi:probable protein phosphatase 2C 24 [Typha latifolia]|uniref:probable protein phosphatase 2C 24 n=1 Tax=Typha latifolia TaxID=4733 RepID=UPI003C2E9388
MAEICCEGAETTAAAVTACELEPSSRSGRRRRMDLRRFKIADSVDGSLPEVERIRKRKRVECSVSSSPAVLETGPVVGAGNGGEDVGSREDRSGSCPDASSYSEHPQARSGGSEESDGCPRYGMTSVCGRRREMEDAVSIRPDFLWVGSKIPGKHHFFGVYDGHGCCHVAVSCQDRMHEVVAEEMGSSSPPSEPSQERWKEMMERSFLRMDAEASSWNGTDGRPNPGCRCDLRPPTRCDHVGSTAVVAIVGPTQIVVANCGDSRAVLSRGGAAVPLSSDHKPDRPDELERIQSAGGRVIYWDGPRVLGVLAMSRAIGDSYLKPYVIPEPEVTVTEREEGDECLILASDGLWDVVTNEMACDVVRMCLRGSSQVGARGEGGGHVDGDKACSDAAMLLTKLALARRSADNVSVVVIDLRRNL